MQKKKVAVIGRLAAKTISEKLEKEVNTVSNIKIKLIKFKDPNEFITEFKQNSDFDIIIMDAFMEYRDAPTMTNIIKNNNDAINVITIVDQYNDSILRYIIESGSLIILDPFENETLRNMVVYLLNKNNDLPLECKFDEHIQKEMISILLKSMGVNSSKNGYAYIKDAILIILKSKNPLNLSITKDIYLDLAIKYDTPPTAVERCMRHTIEIIFSRGNIDLLERVLGYSIRASIKGRPCNSEFLYACADYIKKGA